MDADKIVDAATAMLGGGGALAILLKLLSNRRQNSVDDRVEEFFLDPVQVYDILNDLSTSTGADRILILQATNNGGIPTPNTARFTSVLYEVHGPKVSNVRENWQKVPTDEHYDRLIAKLLGEGTAVVVTNRIPKESALRDVYEAHDIHHSLLFIIGASERGVLFCSLNFTDELSEIGPEGRVAVRRSSSDLRQLFRKYEKFTSRHQSSDDLSK